MKKDQKILRPNPLKTIGLLIVSMLFVASGPILIEKNPIMAWMTISLFGLGVIVFVIQLIPTSSRLKLTKDGFEVKSLFKSNFTKWSDVDRFRVGYVGVGYVGRTKMVMYDFSHNYTKYEVGKKIAKTLSGSEGALPNTYGMKAKELVKLMNEWKKKSQT